MDSGGVPGQFLEITAAETVQDSHLVPYYRNCRIAVANRCTTNIDIFYRASGPDEFKRVLFLNKRY
jgi:hypothetical protein